MTDLEQTIFQAITAEYWNRFGYSTTRMAEAAIQAAGMSEADEGSIKAIIERHLVKPDFVSMAQRIADYLSEGFTVTVNGQGHHFNLGQIHDGEHADKWVWSTKDDESKAFESAVEAQEDAMRYVRELMAVEEPGERVRSYEDQHRMRGW